MPDNTMENFQILWNGASEVIRLAMIVALVYIGREWLKARREDRVAPVAENSNGREPVGERLARIETEMRSHTVMLGDMKSSIVKLSSDMGGRVQGLVGTFEADLRGVDQRLTRIETKCSVREKNHLPCNGDE